MSSRALFALTLLLSAALAASDMCSVFQIHSTIEGLDGVMSSDACADYVSSGSLLSVPCDASGCVRAVEDLVTKLPDCTLSASDNGGSSVNKKTELQNGLNECSSSSSASLSVEAVDTSTKNSATISTSSRSTDDCSNAEANATADLYLEVAAGAACNEYVTTDEAMMTVYIYAPCSATQCVAVMETMAEQLPDCYMDGLNLKQDVLQSLTSCTGPSSAARAFSTSGSSSGNDCSSDEVSSLAYLTQSIVTSNECDAYVIATATAWYIEVPCNATSCLTTLDDTVQQMPDCMFEGTNYKEELGLRQQSCGSDDGSGSAGSTNSLRTAPPASDGSAHLTETSSSALYKIKTPGLTLAQVAIVLLALA